MSKRCHAAKADRPLVAHGDEDIVLGTRAARADRLRLNGSPVRLMEAGEDRLAEHLAQRLQYRFPRPQREFDEGVEVGILERADDDCGGHATVTVPGLKCVAGRALARGGSL